MAYIVCDKCGNCEEINKQLFLKILGGAVSTGGFGAWVTYLFAGTGLAMPICIAIILGGVGIAAYSNEIAGWMSKRYKCSNCGAKSWTVEKKPEQIERREKEQQKKYLAYFKDYCRQTTQKGKDKALQRYIKSLNK